MDVRAKAVARWVTLIPMFVVVSYSVNTILSLVGVAVPAVRVYPDAATALKAAPWDFYLYGVLLPLLKGAVLIAYFYWWAPSHKLRVAFWTLFFPCLLFLLSVKGAVPIPLPLYAPVEALSTVVRAVPSLCFAGSAILVFILLARRVQIEERRAALRRWWLAAILLAVTFLFPTTSPPG